MIKFVQIHGFDKNRNKRKDQRAWLSRKNSPTGPQRSTATAAAGQRKRWTIRLPAAKRQWPCARAARWSAHTAAWAAAPASLPASLTRSISMQMASRKSTRTSASTAARASGSAPGISSAPACRPTAWCPSVPTRKRASMPARSAPARASAAVCARRTVPLTPSM